jgi:hypothetical protein
MFLLYRLRRKRRSIERQFAKALNLRLKASSGSLDDDITDTTSQFDKRLDLIDLQIETVRTAQLIIKAQNLDLQMPPRNDPEMWNLVSERRVLSPKGRIYLRKLIDDENTRRREVSAWWWRNVVIPALTALTGLAGVITGMIAVARTHK